MLSRDDYRKIKAMSREQMDRWLAYEGSLTSNRLRQEYETVYQAELDSSVQNFITAIAYTLHFNEDIHLGPDELNSFMQDLYVSVELFRKGEYNPEDYREQLRGDGIEIAKYDYDKLYKARIDRVDTFLAEKKKEVLENELTKDDMIRIIAEIEAVNKRR